MAKKQINLYLYLALVCFLGIITIFIVDGYMGVYDTIYVTTREMPQKIEADFWQRQAPGYGPYGPVPEEGSQQAFNISTNRGGKVAFRYEVANRLFSSYTADISVAVWHSQQKIRDLLSQPMSLDAFGKGQLEWVVDTVEFTPSDLPTDQPYQFSVVIKRGDLERRIVIELYPGVKVPAPPR